MSNQNKQLSFNGFRQVVEKTFDAKSVSRFLSTVPHFDEENKLTPKSAGELISEAERRSASDHEPPSVREKLKKFAGKLRTYQHELPHSPR